MLHIESMFPAVNLQESLEGILVRVETETTLN